MAIGGVKSMNLNKDTYNRIAEDWHRDHAADDWADMGIDTFLSFLNPGASILDVGCGGGLKVKYMVAQGFNASGVDLAETFITIARREVPDAHFEVLDMLDSQSLTQTYDGILMQASLLHIPKKDAPRVVKDFANKLNPGGYFYLAVKEVRPGGVQKSSELLQDLARYPLELANNGIVKVDSTGRVEEEVKVEDDYGYKYERFFSYFVKEEIAKYFTDAGLEIVKEVTTQTGPSNWLQIIGRKH